MDFEACPSEKLGGLTKPAIPVVLCRYRSATPSGYSAGDPLFVPTVSTQDVTVWVFQMTISAWASIRW